MVAHNYHILYTITVFAQPSPNIKHFLVQVIFSWLTLQLWQYFISRDDTALNDINWWWWMLSWNHFYT
jgi:hypothetical protein